MKAMRQQLLQRLLIGMVLIASATGILVYRHVRRELDDLYNGHLQQLAIMLAHQLDRNDGAQQAADALQGKIAPSWQEEHYLIQVWDRAGRLREQDIPAVTKAVIPLLPSAGLYRKHIGTESWRIYRADSAHIIVQIAQPEFARKRTIAETSLTLWLPLFLQIPLLTLLCWSSVRRGLQPLEQLSAAIARRRPAALQPLDVSTQPVELKPLVKTLNELLARLDTALRQQRNFVADAAHELRTPVAALQLQLDQLQRAQTPSERALAIAELQAGLQRTTHLIQQLLSVARAEFSAEQSLQTIDLQIVSNRALERQLPLARSRHIDLGVARIEAASIHCLLADIEAVLDNLLSNAVRYTPRDGRIDFSLYRDAGVAVLKVADSGPGIPAAEHARIFDRFYRVLQNATDDALPEGSGLGLAIVKTICDRYGAEISIGTGHHGQGAEFVVRWPLLPSP